MDKTLINIISIIDNPSAKTIVAKIRHLPASVYLWKGEQEYTEAGNWTNDSALERAFHVLSLPEVPFVEKKK